MHLEQSKRENSRSSWIRAESKLERERESDRGTSIIVVMRQRHHFWLAALTMLAEALEDAAEGTVGQSDLQKRKGVQCGKGGRDANDAGFANQYAFPTQ